MTLTHDTLFDLPSEHAHVASRDWTKANLCICGLYRCRVLLAMDGYETREVSRDDIERSLDAVLERLTRSDSAHNSRRSSWT